MPTQVIDASPAMFQFRDYNPMSEGLANFAAALFRAPAVYQDAKAKQQALEFKQAGDAAGAADKRRDARRKEVQNRFSSSIGTLVNDGKINIPPAAQAAGLYRTAEELGYDPAELGFTADERTLQDAKAFWGSNRDIGRNYEQFMPRSYGREEARAAATGDEPPESPGAALKWPGMGPGGQGSSAASPAGPQGMDGGASPAQHTRTIPPPVVNFEPTAGVRGTEAPLPQGPGGALQLQESLTAVGIVGDPAERLTQAFAEGHLHDDTAKFLLERPQALQILMDPNASDEDMKAAAQHINKALGQHPHELDRLFAILDGQDVGAPPDPEAPPENWVGNMEHARGAAEGIAAQMANHVGPGRLPAGVNARAAQGELERAYIAQGMRRQDARLKAAADWREIQEQAKKAPQTGLEFQPGAQ